MIIILIIELSKGCFFLQIIYLFIFIIKLLKSYFETLMNQRPVLGKLKSFYNNNYNE